MDFTTRIPYAQWVQNSSPHPHTHHQPYPTAASKAISPASPFTPLATLKTLVLSLTPHLHILNKFCLFISEIFQIFSAPVSVSLVEGVVEIVVDSPAFIPPLLLFHSSHMVPIVAVAMPRNGRNGPSPAPQLLLPVIISSQSHIN